MNNCKGIIKTSVVPEYSPLALNWAISSVNRIVNPKKTKINNVFKSFGTNRLIKNNTQRTIKTHKTDKMSAIVWRMTTVYPVQMKERHNSILTNEQSRWTFSCSASDWYFISKGLSRNLRVYLFMIVLKLCWVISWVWILISKAIIIIFSNLFRNSKFFYSSSKPGSKKKWNGKMENVLWKKNGKKGFLLFF